MEDFLAHLKAKAYQNRKVAIMENGTWAPSAGKVMLSALEGMKNLTICENKVLIRSTMKQNNIEEMEKLAEELLG